MDEEGWQIAGPAPESAGRRRGGRSGRRRGGKGEGPTTPHFQYREQTNHKLRRAAPSSDEDDTATALQRWDARLSTFKQELAASGFLGEVQKVLEKAGALEEVNRVAEVVCYGIGNFSSSKRAGYQFALLLLLRQWLTIEDPIRLFEPFLTEFEKGVLVHHGCELITKNEEAKRVAQGRTLFFMPHVDKCLYSNLLWANWGEESLPNVIIFGNSFVHYDERIISQAERRKAPYMFKALEVMEEHTIERAFDKMKEAFNDQCVIAFRRGGDKMAQAALKDATFWSRSRECDLPSLAHGSSDVVSGGNKHGPHC